MTSGLPRRRGRTHPVLRPFEAFFALESASGLLLLSAAAAALAWANSPWGPAYFHLWETPLSLGVGSFALSKSLHHWINDGLMAVFFFVVGLELKRELLMGELASPRRAALSVAAALGGMIVPALVYAALNRGTAGAAGWGIPMATDIAFALGVIALLGPRVPGPLKVFVTAVAIVDDLGAVLVIAFFYTAAISWSALGAAALALLALIAINRLGVRRTLPYLLIGLVLWVALLKSGVHATIAGVLLAFTIPARPPAHLPDATTPLAALEQALHGWVAFLIVPIFAFANAGVSLAAEAGSLLHSPVALGVLLGLLAGKPAGILLAAWLALRTRAAVLPEGVRWAHLGGAAMLCGIGFTMSLFIATLAFDPEPALLDHAKVGVLAASLLAGTAGAVILSRVRSAAG